MTNPNSAQNSSFVDNSFSEDSNYLKKVREQYENYPYPPRNPEEERERFLYSPISALDFMNYYHFSGKRDFSKGFKVLIAGGGTGDDAMLLGEQLRDTDAKIVYLDFSAASMQVAKERAKVRGLTNITWVHGSLLDAAKLLEDKFDFINCMGVLHHLDSPEAGLASLKQVLKDDGVMALMLYAQYGRESIYQIQNLMRVLNKGEENLQKRVDNCKAVLKNLPASHPFKQIEQSLNDAVHYGDNGIYDLFLHTNDVAYTVPQVYEFVATSGLKLTHFTFLNDVLGNNTYKMESYLLGDLPDVMQKLSTPEKQAAAELMNGRILRHAFYASNVQNPLPSIDDLDNVPFFCMQIKRAAYGDIYNILSQLPQGQNARMNMFGKEINFIVSKNALAFFKYLDGKRTLREIFDNVKSDYRSGNKKPTNEELLVEFEQLFSIFAVQDWMLLRHKSVPDIKTVYEIQQRTTQLLAKQ